jgi:hypothetical protein
MGGIYIAIEKQIPGFDPFVNGKAVSRAKETDIDRICTEAGVRSLWAYVSQDPDELAGFLEDEGMTPEGNLPEEEWYDPGKGCPSSRSCRVISRPTRTVSSTLLQS